LFRINSDDFTKKAATEKRMTQEIGHQVMTREHEIDCRELSERVRKRFRKLRRVEECKSVSEVGMESVFSSGCRILSSSWTMKHLFLGEIGTGGM
jgi:hypothetical protein